jgi:hypothetical protein
MCAPVGCYINDVLNGMTYEVVSKPLFIRLIERADCISAISGG